MLLNGQEFDIDSNDENFKSLLLGSPLAFTKTMFELRRGQPFNISTPPGRECRHITIQRQLKRVFRGECKRLIICIPPRYAKTEHVVNFIPWTYAHYPDSNNLYISYAQSVATRQTQIIRDIITMPIYRHLFGVEIDKDSSAKHNFQTTKRGEVFAAGAGGSITSRGAGISGLGGSRYGGAIWIDDIHKPLDVYSDTIRKETNDWYFNTLYSRLNDPSHTPIVVIGQRLHEDDLIANLLKQKNADGTPEWEVICLPAMDINGNPLDPLMHTKAMLLEMQRREPYSFSAQYQQEPLPLGGGIFQKSDFIIMEEEPNIELTFITADTAESAKEYADETVFSFWGLYRIHHHGIDSGLYGLHWIACRATRCEPKDLEGEFFGFYADCMRHKVKPGVAAIEKKSTGVTLCSILKGTPGLRIIDIDRNRSGGSKIARFMACQPYVNEHRVSFTEGAKHIEMCVTHMSKITGNNSHLHDDVGDTLQAALQISLMEGMLLPRDKPRSHIAARLNERSQYITQLRKQI